jgi:hypothetical protein
MGFEVLPPGTAANDANALVLAGGSAQKASASFVVTATAGEHTFEAKYRTSGPGTCTFASRSIWGIPLP